MDFLLEIAGGCCPANPRRPRPSARTHAHLSFAFLRHTRVTQGSHTHTHTPSLSHARTHARTRAHTIARAHAGAHTRTHSLTRTCRWSAAGRCTYRSPPPVCVCVCACVCVCVCVCACVPSVFTRFKERESSRDSERGRDQEWGSGRDQERDQEWGASQTVRRVGSGEPASQPEKKLDKSERASTSERERERED